MLLPRLLNIRTVRAGNNERPFLYQNDRRDLMCWIALHPRDVSRRVGQQCIAIVTNQTIRKLAIAFLEKSRGQSQIFHSGKRPTASGPVSVDDDGFDGCISSLWYWGKHVPGLKQSRPEEIRSDQVLPQYDDRA